MKPPQNNDWNAYDSDPTASLAKDVYDRAPEWSGLYDKDGNRLYRKKEPIGFYPLKERE